MLNINIHKVTLIKILKEIYSDIDLRTLLGFKGGTAAMLFYGLPRFSVDLDFDLLNEDKKKLVFDKLQDILSKFGKSDEPFEKYHTLFFLLNYQKRERNLKVEVSKRESTAAYEIKHYLGIPMMVMQKADMTAGKLAALLTRKRFAVRDIFDLWFFLKENFPINGQIVKDKTGLSLQKALLRAEAIVKDLKGIQLLSGLGDLLDPKQRIWVKQKLQEELLFLLRFYIASVN